MKNMYFGGDLQEHTTCKECSTQVLGRMYEDNGAFDQQTTLSRAWLYDTMQEAMELQAHGMPFQSIRVCMLCIRA